MKKYRLKIKYPNLFQKNEIGDIVYYNSLTKNYVKAEAPHYSVSAYDVENFPDCWELIEDQEPLFIAGDGAVFFDDVYYLVTKPYFVKTKLKAKESIYKGDGFIYFKHESNADEYIWKNKPVFSYEDMMKAKHSIILTSEDIEKSAKERSVKS